MILFLNYVRQTYPDLNYNYQDPDQIALQQQITYHQDVIRDDAASDPYKPNLTVLHQESPDVFSLLPPSFLPDYGSYCWYLESGDLRCLPKVYLAGMPKCGSTDLFNKLVWHPELAPTKQGKENHYWARGRVGRPRNHVAGLGAGPRITFSEHLAHITPAQLTSHPELQLVDGTQSLLWDLGGWEGRYSPRPAPPYTNADLLHAVTPGAKVLVITRDPVRRLYSDYLYFNRDRTSASFHSAVLAELARFRGCLEEADLTACCYSSRNDPKLRLHLGIYGAYIADWRRVFGGNVLVVSLEDYSDYPIPNLIRIFSFLGLSQPDVTQLQGFVENSKRRNERPKSEQSKGDMLLETRQLLEEFYRPYNSELAKMLQDTRFLYKYD